MKFISVGNSLSGSTFNNNTFLDYILHAIDFQLKKNNKDMNMAMHFQDYWLVYFLVRSVS